MKISPTGRAFIEAFEGKSNHAYDDGTGVWTIGYGHTTAAGSPVVVRGMEITDAQCDLILASDLEKVERTVGAVISAPLEQCQFDALGSFEFNTGDLARSSIPEKIDRGDLADAMDTLVMYDHAGRPLRRMAGLERRRNAERLMFEGRVDEAMRLAGAHAADPASQMPKASKPAPAPAPAPAKTVSGGWLDWIISIFKAIFGRK